MVAVVWGSRRDAFTLICCLGYCCSSHLPQHAHARVHSRTCTLTHACTHACTRNCVLHRIDLGLPETQWRALLTCQHYKCMYYVYTIYYIRVVYIIYHIYFIYNLLYVTLPLLFLHVIQNLHAILLTCTGPYNCKRNYKHSLLPRRVKGWGWVERVQKSVSGRRITEITRPQKWILADRKGEKKQTSSMNVKQIKILMTSSELQKGGGTRSKFLVSSSRTSSLPKGDARAARPAQVQVKWNSPCEVHHVWCSECSVCGCCCVPAPPSSGH